MPRDNKENGRKRRYSDVLEDLYRGPQEFMEAGARGFLVTSIPDREEHSIDETVKVLRKTCVKLFGGIKPLKREDASFAKGYIMVDFMDPDTVVSLPHPDAEKVAEEEKAKAAEEAVKEEGKENEEMEEENKQEEEAKPEGEDADGDKAKTEGEDKPEDEAKAEDGAKPDAEAENTTTEEGKEVKETKVKEEKKKKEDTRRKRDDDKKPLMLAPHKFKGFRTELRNIMFIKSDIPDPVEVVNACFDLMLDRKPLYTDCVNQLLPVQGVCENDYKQLEIMCRRVLVPYVGEQLEKPPSFGVMLVNKMCEPGAEVLLEVVRSAIWCLNPCAWQCSPWAEPDVVVHIEIIGSKIILSAMPHYMKYRQYSPFALYELGRGKPEDEVQLLKEKSEDYHFRARGSRGGRRKDKSGKNKEQGEKGEKKENGEKEKAGKDPAEGESVVEKEAEQPDQTQQSDEVKGAEQQKEEEQSTEAASEEKKEEVEKKTPTRTRGGQKAKS